MQKRLDEIVAVVESARSMPMSASCVVNRGELLSMLDEIRAALPDSLAQAQAVLGDREQVVEEARREAERILASAHAERGSLVSDTRVARESQEQADRTLADAKRDAEEIRAEADDYVDSKLANFEVVLTKTIAAVDRGREKLLGRGPGVDEHGQPDADAPERPTDPDELRRLADAYVDTKLGSFEAVLGRTLEAVGRGRQKLLGRRPIDELPQYQDDGQDDAGAQVRQSDADYVAALAEQPPVQPAAGEQVGYGAYGYGYQNGGYPAPAYTSDGAPSYPLSDSGHPQDGYPPAQAGYGPDYGWQQQDAYGGYSTEGHGYSPPQSRQAPAQAGPEEAGTLDETSFFDTSMIDVEQLRELEGGR